MSKVYIVLYFENKDKTTNHLMNIKAFDNEQTAKNFDDYCEKQGWVHTIGDLEVHSEIDV